MLSRRDLKYRYRIRKLSSLDRAGRGRKFRDIHPTVDAPGFSADRGRRILRPAFSRKAIPRDLRGSVVPSIVAALRLSFLSPFGRTIPFETFYLSSRTRRDRRFGKCDFACPSGSSISITRSRNLRTLSIRVVDLQ